MEIFPLNVQVIAYYVITSVESILRRLRSKMQTNAVGVHYILAAHVCNDIP